MATETTIGDDVVIDLRDGPPAGDLVVIPDPATPATAPAPAPADLLADERRHRTIRLVALGLLVVLNALDILTTEAFLRAGVKEGNPIAVAAVEGGWMIYVKAVLLLGLGVRFARRRPTLGSTCVAWFVVGIYCMVVYVNLMVLRAAGGTLF